MSKERFVNDKILFNKLPMFLCTQEDMTDEKLERLIDMIE